MIATYFALLVPLQNVKKSAAPSSRYPPFFSPFPFACCVGVYTITHWWGCLVRVSFVLSLLLFFFFFSPNTVYVHSPVIPCTYLLLVSMMGPLPYCLCNCAIASATSTVRIRSLFFYLCQSRSRSRSGFDSVFWPCHAPQWTQHRTALELPLLHVP